MDFIIPYHSDVIGKPILELGLPAESVITLIVRNDQYLVPNGTAVLVLLVLLKKASIHEVNQILSTVKSEQAKRDAAGS
jgi:cell volume regulation protein A